VRGRQLTA